MVRASGAAGVEGRHVLEKAGRMSSQIAWPAADAANSEAVRRMAAAQPVFVDIQLAGEVMPDLDGRVILHA